MNHSSHRRRRTHTVLGLTVGQWQTVVLAVLLAAILLAATLPPVLEEVR